MKFTSYSLSHKGLRREINEDSFLINEQNNIFLVADGMGGHKKGEVASKIVVETVNETICNHRLLNITNEKHLPNIIQEAVINCSKKINDYCLNNKIESNMGSTLVGFYKHKDIKKLSHFHLGDSRAYKIRNTEIIQLTKDHSLYEEKKAENLKKEELEKINKHQLTKAIGNFNTHKIDLSYTSLEDGDIFILCSDGITNFISDEYILRLILKHPLDKVAEYIKDVVFNNGARDNLSLIIIQYNI